MSVVHLPQYAIAGRRPTLTAQFLPRCRSCEKPHPLGRKHIEMRVLAIKASLEVAEAEDDRAAVARLRGELYDLGAACPDCGTATSPLPKSKTVRTSITGWSFSAVLARINFAISDFLLSLARTIDHD